MLFFSIKDILLIGKNICGCIFFSNFLLCNILSVSSNYLLVFYNIKINFLLYSKYLYLLHKKLLGWPLAYIFKNHFFYKVEIFLDIGVLVPRYETYIFINKLLNIIVKNNSNKFLELGYGSGVLSLLLGSCDNLSVNGVDNDLNSFFYSIKNMYNFNISNINFYYNSWNIFYCFELKFDIIFSNPPYICFDSFVIINNYLIPFESKISLFSDNYGINDIIFIIKISYNFLKHGGFLIIEHSYRHSFIIRKIFYYFGYNFVNTYIDSLYLERITIGKKY